jgi:hypothetical protein
MPTPRTSRTVRVDADTYAYVKFSAAASQTSIVDAHEGIISQYQRLNPPVIVIRRCKEDGGEFYTATVGENSLDDFFTGTTKKAATSAALDMIKQLGCERIYVCLDYRTQDMVDLSEEQDEIVFVRNGRVCNRPVLQDQRVRVLGWADRVTLARAKQIEERANPHTGNENGPAA